MDNFSQSNEQFIIISYFKDFKGTFLDIGSNDGITLSNTHALSLNDWFGVCIEPSPKAFAQLAGNYLHNDNIYCFNFAISDFNGKSLFFDSGTHLNKGDHSLLSTLNKKETERWHSTTSFESINVDVVDFKSFLKINPIKEFTFISIDAEGEDFKILQQMDLIQLNCKAICIEHNGNKNVLEEIESYCSLFGLNKELLLNAENIILSV